MFTSEFSTPLIAHALHLEAMHNVSWAMCHNTSDKNSAENSVSNASFSPHTVSSTRINRANKQQKHKRTWEKEQWSSYDRDFYTLMAILESFINFAHCAPWFMLLTDITLSLWCSIKVIELFSLHDKCLLISNFHFTQHLFALPAFRYVQCSWY